MDNVQNVGADLVRIHKVITRALVISIQNSQPGSLAEQNRQGFILYLRSLVILLHGHHTGEDELAFPYWQARYPSGQFDDLAMQHRQMLPYLEQIVHWIEPGLDAWKAHSLGELHASLSALQRLWETHITLEEATVGPENSLKYLTREENQELGQQLSQHGQASSQPAELVMPFIFYNLPGAERAEFMKLFPPVLTEQLVPVAWKAAWEPMRPFLVME